MGLCLCRRRYSYENITSLSELIELIENEINYFNIPESESNNDDTVTAIASTATAVKSKGMTSTYDIREYASIVKLKMSMTNLNNHLRVLSESNDAEVRQVTIVDVKDILRHYYQWKQEQSPPVIVVNKPLCEQINSDIYALIKKGKK